MGQQEPPADPYLVIIDNMMNLEMLFEASRLTGDPRFRDVAVAHANTTLRNHFREDGSAYHIVVYDSATGRVREHRGGQGYSSTSAWARGQSWGLYGFTMCYRETGDARYLARAVKSAEYILNHPNLPRTGFRTGISTVRAKSATLGGRCHRLGAARTLGVCPA
ncbi:MAG: hypothetical protein V8Q54_10965 [Alistipes senegalensis]